MTIKVEDNIVLLGAPRSGTSFLTSILHNPPSRVCLSEPREIDELTQSSNSPKEFVSGLLVFMEQVRDSIARGIPVENRIDPLTGELAENYAVRSEKSSGNWEISSGFQWQSQNIPIPMKKFQLLVKRNAPLVAVVDQLIDCSDLTVLGMLRDPIATILSWRSLDLPISQGHLHAAELISSELRGLVTEPNLLLRQVKILNWIFERVSTYVPMHAIICYEDLVDDPYSALAPTGLTISRKVSPLHSRNSSIYYDHSEVDRIWELIEKHAPHILMFQGGRYGKTKGNRTSSA